MALISKIHFTYFMTEQKLVNPSLKSEESLSWKELQGLGWIFSEDEL